MPYRVYVPKTWDGKASLPIILMLHGAGANESTYLDQAEGLLMTLAEQHRYIVVSPLGFTAMGAYGNPLRLPAVFGQSAAAASQRAAVTPARQRELNLSELEVMTGAGIVAGLTYWAIAGRSAGRWRRRPTGPGRSAGTPCRGGRRAAAGRRSARRGARGRRRRTSPCPASRR